MRSLPILLCFLIGLARTVSAQLGPHEQPIVKDETNTGSDNGKKSKKDRGDTTDSQTAEPKFTGNETETTEVNPLPNTQDGQHGVWIDKMISVKADGKTFLEKRQEAAKDEPTAYDHPKVEGLKHDSIFVPAAAASGWPTHTDEDGNTLATGPDGTLYRKMPGPIGYMRLKADPLESATAHSLDMRNSGETTADSHNARVHGSALGEAVATMHQAEVVQRRDSQVFHDAAQLYRQEAQRSTGRQRQTALIDAGGSDLGAGEDKEAERDFRQAVDEYPTNARARTGLALALQRQGRGDEAHILAKEALALDPNERMAKVILGQEENNQKAKGVARKFSQLAANLWKGPSPDGTGGQFRTGFLQPSQRPTMQTQSGAPALSNIPRDAQAVQVLRGTPPQPTEPSVAMTPMLPPASMAHYKEAFGKLQVRDMTGALLEATASVNDSPNSAAPWVLRAYIDNRLTPRPNPQGAVSDAGRALRIEPQNAAALREKALGEITQGEIQTALTDLAAAIQLDPKNGTGYLYRAMANEKLGKAADAVADYNQAASLDPALTPFASDALTRLGGAKFAQSPSPGPSGRNRKLMRGGMIGLALVLILAGMLGTEAGRKLITQRAVFTTKGARFDRTLAPSRALSAGEVIGGNYRVARELGRGGMGIVYEALDLALQRKVAVKQLQRTETAAPEDLERFLQEARLVAKLRNPRLVEIYNVINEGDLFLVFEYMDGKSLDQVLGSRRKLSLPEVHQALADVGGAVDYAHSQNVIHRDLKPANVMVERDGRCKVMDFGIAHQSQAATFLTQTVASGTPPYMAPEQAFGSVSKASDLYAMGVMAYEMATGRRPFAGPDYVEQKLQRRFETVTSSRLPATLDAFFQKALDPDPTKRFQSASELLQGFRTACAAQPV